MRFFVILTSLVLALAAVACGSSNDSSGGILGNKGGDSSSSSGNAPPATKAPGGTTSSTPAATAKPGGSTAGTPNPCSILSKADAAAALGKPVNDGKLTESTGPLGQKLCFYSASDATSASSVQLSLITSSGLTDQMKKNGWSAKQQYDSEKKLSANTPVGGIGDDAFFRGPNLYVLKGDTDMNLLLANGTPGTPEQAAALKALALKLLPKLP